MKGTVRGALLVGLSLIFLGSLAGVAVHIINDKRGAEDYAEAASLIQLPDLPERSAVRPRPTPAANDVDDTPAAGYVWEDPYADALRDMDFSALREVNPDVIGWIVIPDTVISYPLLHGEDNDYYLKHTWKGDRNAVGSIFLESRCNADLSNFNTIVYGHRMRGGSMFGTLKDFSRTDYWNAHPYVYLATEQGQYTYAIFAAYEAELESDTYRIHINDETERRNALDAYVGCSQINTGIVPAVNDRILTLSTCTGNGHATRWVVQAVLVEYTAPEPGEETPALDMEQQADAAPADAEPSVPEESTEAERF